MPEFGFYNLNSISHVLIPKHTCDQNEAIVKAKCLIWLGGDYVVHSYLSLTLHLLVRRHATPKASGKQVGTSTRTWSEVRKGKYMPTVRCAIVTFCWWWWKAWSEMQLQQCEANRAAEVRRLTSIHLSMFTTKCNPTLQELSYGILIIVCNFEIDNEENIWKPRQMKSTNQEIL